MDLDRGGVAARERRPVDICEESNAATADLQDPAEITSKLQPFLDELKALDAPDELKSAQDDFVSISQQQQTALEAGDLKQATSLIPDSNVAGSKMGAPGCAGSSTSSG